MFKALKFRFCLALLSILLTQGCATLSGPGVEHDPWEGFNRSMYSFNDGLDTMILRPTAEAYVTVVPSFARTGVHNVFSNLGDALVIVNDIFQVKAGQTLKDSARFILNSTIGLLGLFDVATPLGLPKHSEDFGQTLGRWGVSSGPYLVMPFIGASNLRDAAGLYPDMKLSLMNDIKPKKDYYAAVAVNVIDIRSGLLEASTLLDTAALDPYVFMREAYLQRREFLVYDGNPPANDDDLFDDEDIFDDEELFEDDEPSETSETEENLNPEPTAP